MNKRQINWGVFVMILTVALVFLGCGNLGRARQNMQAGIYTATVRGYGGLFDVTVEVSRNAIVSITIDEHFETRGVGCAAIQRIPEQIVRYQSLAVDMVAGETVTSAVIIDAVAQCIAQAGGDVRAFFANAVPPRRPRGDVEMRADVIVIGGGGAGVVAAVEVIQNGGSVILVEKMPMLGGNTAISLGALSGPSPYTAKRINTNAQLLSIVEDALNHPAFNEEFRQLQNEVREEFEAYRRSGATYIFDTGNFFALQTLIGGDGKGRVDLVRTMGNNIVDSFRWYQRYANISFRFVQEHSTSIGTGVLYARFNRAATLDGTVIGHTYSAYIERPAQIIRESGNTILLEVRARELIMENNRITGVRATHADGTRYTFHANNAVILTTGGYGSNLEMVRQFHPTAPMRARTTPGTMGDGITMGLAVGAALEGMDYIQIHPLGDLGSPQMDSGVAGGGAIQNVIFVNREGVRFVDETERRDVLANAILSQTDRMMFSIYDSIYAASLSARALENFEAFGLLHRAYTIAELAVKMGVDVATLERTVSDYNRAVAGEIPMVPAKSVWELPIAQPPFFAVPRTPTIHHTMGGLRINTNAQVLNERNEPIAGLLAAGEVAGGLHGSNRLGGGAMAEVVVFGRIAGNYAMGRDINRNPLR